jgi:hypothetical protein
MAKFDLLKKIWAHRKIREICILITLIIALIVVLVINFQPPAPKASERVLICDQCGYSNMMEFTEIKFLHCPECSVGKMRYGMKCGKCEYEFPYISSPLTKKQMKKMNSIRAQRILDRRCPNCADVEAFPLSNFAWQKKHGKK